MLVTHGNYLLTDHLYMLDKGEQLWGRVDLELGGPYYFVNYEIEEAGMWIKQHSLLWLPQSFIAFCKFLAQNPRQNLSNVSLLMPPTISRSEHWHMISLQSIWMAGNRNGTKRFFIYIAEDGTRYAEHSAGDVSDEALVDIEQFYPLPPEKTT